MFEYNLNFLLKEFCDTDLKTLLQNYVELRILDPPNGSDYNQTRVRVGEGILILNNGKKINQNQNEIRRARDTLLILKIYLIPTTIVAETYIVFFASQKLYKWWS